MRVLDAKVAEVAGAFATGVEPQTTSETVVVNMSTEGLHLALEIKKVETRSVCSPKRRLPLYWV